MNAKLPHISPFIQQGLYKTTVSYKICFSIPCHESVECVEDLIWNIRFFAPNSAVVLHANHNSGQKFYNELNELEDRYDFVAVNDQQFPLQWGDGVLLNAFP